MPNDDMPPPVGSLEEQRARREAARTQPAIQALPHPADRREEIKPESPHRDAWIRWLIGGGIGILFTVGMLVWSGPDLVNVGGLLAIFTLFCMVWVLVFPVIVGIQVWKAYSFPRKMREYRNEIAEIETTLREEELTEAERRELGGDLRVAKHYLKDTGKDYEKWKKGFGWLLPVLSGLCFVYGLVSMVIWVVRTF